MYEKDDYDDVKVKKSYTAYYAIDPDFGHGPRLTVHGLFFTHKAVRRFYAADLDEVYYQMQGEAWSPNGGKRDLIKSLGLNHTSMSIGDVILDEEAQRYYVVDFVGFSEIK